MAAVPYWKDEITIFPKWLPRRPWWISDESKFS